MKDYAKEMMDMRTEFDYLCKKYNHTGVAVVMEGKVFSFLSSVETDTDDEYIELIARGFDTLVGAMFTCYGNDKLKVAKDRLGYALNKRYCQRLNMAARTKPEIMKRKDNWIRGKILRDWQGKGIVLILGDDKQRYLGHWDYEKYGKPKQSKKVYFIPDAPESGGNGRWKLTRCPFHDDHNPSFWIDTKNQICGCHSGCTPLPLDVIGLYGRLHGVDNFQAIKEMAGHL